MARIFGAKDMSYRRYAEKTVAVHVNREVAERKWWMEKDI